MKSYVIPFALAALAMVGASLDAAPRTVTTATQEEFPIPAGFRSGYETIDGVKLHFVRGGQGPVVLLVHGFGQTWYEWNQLMPELADRYTVIAVELPGLGLSDAPRTSYTGVDISEYLYKFAKRFSPDKPFYLVAHDIGIWNSYPMVARHPADIVKAAFIEATIPDDTLYALPAFVATGEAPGWHHSFFAADDQLADAMVKGNERLFLTHFLRHHASNKAALTDGLIERYVRSYSKPQTFHHAFEYIARFRDQSSRITRWPPRSFRCLSLRSAGAATVDLAPSSRKTFAAMPRTLSPMCCPIAGTGFQRNVPQRSTR